MCLSSPTWRFQLYLLSWLVQLLNIILSWRPKRLRCPPLTSFQGVQDSLVPSSWYPSERLCNGHSLQSVGWRTFSSTFICDTWFFACFLFFLMMVKGGSVLYAPSGSPTYAAVCVLWDHCMAYKAGTCTAWSLDFLFELDSWACIISLRTWARTMGHFDALCDVDEHTGQCSTTFVDSIGCNRSVVGPSFARRPCALKFWLLLQRLSVSSVASHWLKTILDKFYLVSYFAEHLMSTCYRWIDE